jgi:hypothetical protein
MSDDRARKHVSALSRYLAIRIDAKLYAEIERDAAILGWAKQGDH